MPYQNRQRSTTSSRPILHGFHSWSLKQSITIRRYTSSQTHQRRAVAFCRRTSRPYPAWLVRRIRCPLSLEPGRKSASGTCSGTKGILLTRTDHLHQQRTSGQAYIRHESSRYLRLIDTIVCASSYHRCKKRFLRFYYFFKKRVFNVFYFWNVFYFLLEKFFILLNLLKSILNLLNFSIKRLLSDGFNTAAIKIVS